MTTLTDTVRIQAPDRSPVMPVSPLDPSWDTASEPSEPSERSFEDGPRSSQWGRLAMRLSSQPLWAEAA